MEGRLGSDIMYSRFSKEPVSFYHFAIYFEFVFIFVFM